MLPRRFARAHILMPALLLGLVLHAAPVTATGCLSGNQTSTTWSGTVEICSAGAAIPAGQTITIAGGTTLDFDSTSQLQVSGTLTGSGFTMQLTPTMTTQYYGIVAESGGTVTLSQATISGGDGSLQGIFYVNGGTLSLANSTMTPADGVAIYQFHGNLTATGNTITFCKTSCATPTNTGYGIFSELATANIQHNDIENADYAGIYIYGPSGTTTVRFNKTINDGTAFDGSSGGNGIVVDTDNTGYTPATVSNNLIENNGTGTAHAYAGLYLNNADNAVLTCNQIESNDTGIVVAAGTATVTHSDLFGNTTQDVAVNTGALTAPHDWWGHSGLPTAGQITAGVTASSPLSADAGSYTTCGTLTPTATTGALTAVGATTATIAGTVNPNGLDTVAGFYYGQSPGFGSGHGNNVDFHDIGEDVVPTSYSFTLTGLLPGTTYSIRTTATNAQGYGNGTTLTFTTCANQPGLSDDFSCPNINEKWLKVNPGGSASFTPQNPGVLITAPAGYDLSSGNAPRLLQNTQGDLTVRVHVAANPEPSAGQEAGLIFWQDKYDYVYFTRGANGVELVSNTGGTPSTVASAPATGDVTLELIRTGNAYTASFQQDGGEWVKLATTHVALNDINVGPYTPSLQVGLLVNNTAPSTTAFGATFSQFNALSGIPGRWSLTGPLNNARFGQVMVPLNNGTVLMLGGDTTQAEIYNPATGAWSLTGSMNVERHNPIAVLLNNGNVLVAGGSDALGNPLGSTEIYNSAIGAFSLTGNLLTARTNAGAVLLPTTGKVLIAGGDGGSGPLSSAELFTLSSVTTGSWASAGVMSVARDNFALVSLQNHNVLAAGGGTASGVTAAADLYNIGTNSWSSAGAMSVARQTPAAALLPDGTVMVAGGNDTAGNATNAADIYTPGTNSWTPGPSLNTPQGAPAFTTLPDGRLLVAGGYSTTQRLATVETYNPGVKAWSNEYPMHDARYGASAAVLTTGQVLISAGKGVSGYLASTELWDPDVVSPRGAPGSWQAVSGGISCNAGNCIGADASSVTLPSGQILVAGGCCDASGNSQTLAGLYTPGTNSWTWSTMNTGRESFTLTYLPASGDVVAIGGFQQGAGGTTYLTSAEIYNPGANTWTTTTNTMATPRASHTAALLGNGQVLVAGGLNTGGSLASAELFDPTANGTTTNPVNGSWAGTGSMAEARVEHTMTLLANGKVVVIGGMSMTSAAYIAMHRHQTAQAAPLKAGAAHAAGPAPALEPNPTARYLTSAETYDPATGAWTLAPTQMPVARAFHTATLLSSGNILVAGGFNAAQGYLDDCLLFSPTAGSWSACGRLGTVRGLATAIPLAGGTQVLVAGGQNDSTGYLPTTEVYSASTNTWLPGMLLPVPRTHATIATTSTGALLFGGTNDAGTVSEIDQFTAGTATSAVQIQTTVPYYTPLDDLVDGYTSPSAPTIFPETRIDTTHFSGTIVVPTGTVSPTYDYVLFDPSGAILDQEPAGCTQGFTITPSAPTVTQYDTVPAWCGFTAMPPAAMLTFTVTVPSSTTSVCIAGDLINGLDPAATHLALSGTTATGTVTIPESVSGAGINLNYYYTECSAATPESGAPGTLRSLGIGSSPTQTRADTVTSWGAGIPSMSYPAVSSSGFGATTATVRGTITFNGASSVSYHFEYGLDSGSGPVYSTNTATATASGPGPTTVSASLTGLLTGQVYHFRLVLSPPSGTVNGADQSFVTAQALSSGWNLLSVPTAPLSPYSARQLLNEINAQNGGSSGYAAMIATYGQGAYSLFVPGYSDDMPIAPGSGIFVLVKGGAGSWHAAGTPAGSPLSLSLSPGWNLVGERLPSSHTAQSIVSQISPACSPPVSSACPVSVVVLYGATSYTSWLPGASSPPAIATAQGFWIEMKSAVTWTQ